MRTIYLMRLQDGTLINFGRHGPNKQGAAVWYSGEALEVMNLILKYSKETDV